jgi:S1-C subfamily serine protease
MRTLVVVLVVLISVTLGGLAQGQSEPYGATVLRAVTVTLRAASLATMQGGMCHGFLYAIAGRIAYVVTAKHCVEEPSQTRLFSGMQWRDLKESISISFANHSAALANGVYWATNYDVVVLRATVGLFRPKTTYVEVCRCGYYRNFGSSQRIPILSTLSAGGGPAVVSSGYVISGRPGQYAVLLPSAPGTSGSMVVDLQGRLVGIVWGVWSQAKEGAGYRSEITPAPVVMGLVHYAFDRDGVPYTSQ